MNEHRRAGADGASHPYVGLPPGSFWRTGVAANVGCEGIPALYTRKFTIEATHGVATAGSCFAQHVARHLRVAGFKVMDVEPPPFAMGEASAARFGFGLYSARYGNIYLVRQLLQLAQDAFGASIPPDVVWRRGEAYVDALRPSVEPDGLPSPEDVLFLRGIHLEHVRRLFQSMDVFIFTLGLTEGWADRETGRVYPMCPGTIAGEFDPARHVFRNFSYPEIREDALKFHALIKSVNPGVKMILSVSPVPLVATAGAEHVLAATTYSKSVLRAVAGDLAASSPDIDYFPSYELITGATAQGRFFEDDLRTVSAAGVEAVMRMFLDQHPAVGQAPPEDERPARETRARTAQQVECEEILLEAFAR